MTRNSSQQALSQMSDSLRESFHAMVDTLQELQACGVSCQGANELYLRGCGWRVSRRFVAEHEGFEFGLALVTLGALNRGEVYRVLHSAANNVSCRVPRELLSGDR